MFSGQKTIKSNENRAERIKSDSKQAKPLSKNVFAPFIALCPGRKNKSKTLTESFLKVAVWQKRKNQKKRSQREWRQKKKTNQ